MVTQTADITIRNAMQYTSCSVGMCLQYVRTWFDIQAGTNDAATAWGQALGKHPGDRNPPRGAPMFWTGGSQGYGHIALAKQDNNSNKQVVRSTDVQYAGAVSDVALPWFDEHWTGLDYAGWAEGFNGTWIPYLKNPPTDDDWRAYGLVYVERLVRGQQDSDSVARLRYRLQHHNQMPNNQKPGYGSGYGPDTQQAVAYWLNNIDPKQGQGGPNDGSQLNNGPANRLFGDHYQVIEE